MGIRGLSTFLKKRFPHLKKPVIWNDFRGRKIAIDLSTILYRARGADLSALTVIAGLIVSMRQGGVEPIVVFDGSAGVAKADVLAERREKRVAVQKQMTILSEELTNATTDMEQSVIHQQLSSLRKQAPIVKNSEKSDIKKFLYAAGVLFITATEEADSLLAELSRNGDVAGVVSTDTDMLARGVSVLIVPEREDAGFLTTIQLADILYGLQMEFDMFVRACVWMGTDYSPSRMNPWAAIEASKSGTYPTDETNDNKIIHLLTNAQSLEELLSEKQFTKWIAGTQSPEKENLEKICKEQGWPLSWRRILGNVGT